MSVPFTSEAVGAWEICEHCDGDGKCGPECGDRDGFPCESCFGHGDEWVPYWWYWGEDDE